MSPRGAVFTGLHLSTPKEGSMENQRLKSLETQRQELRKYFSTQLVELARDFELLLYPSGESAAARAAFAELLILVDGALRVAVDFPKFEIIENGGESNA